MKDVLPRLFWRCRVGELGGYGPFDKWEENQPSALMGLSWPHIHPHQITPATAVPPRPVTKHHKAQGAPSACADHS